MWREKQLLEGPYSDALSLSKAKTILLHIWNSYNVFTAFKVRQQISCSFTWQSTSLSQTQLAGMQDEFPHWNSLGAQEDGEHATSSEPSPQSSSPLQTKLREMQRPLAHVNSFGAQVIFPEKCIQKVNIDFPLFNIFCQPRTSGRHLKANLENRKTVRSMWLQIWQAGSAHLNS